MGDEELELSNGFRKCPRCNEVAYEKLATHACCLQCNYSPDFEVPDDPNNIIWAARYLKSLDRISEKEREDALQALKEAVSL